MSNVFWNEATPVAAPGDFSRAYVAARLQGAAPDGSQDQFAQIPIQSLPTAASHIDLAPFMAADPNSSADFSVALDNALLAAAATGIKFVSVGPGIYKAASNSARVIRIHSDVTLRFLPGAVVQYNDVIGSPRPFLSSNNLGAYDVVVDGLVVQGNWGAGDYTTTGSHLIDLENCGNVEIKNCKVSGSRNMGIVVQGSGRVHVHNGTVDGTKADGIHIFRCSSALVHHNTIRNNNDDAISVISEDADGSPTTQSATVTDNQVEFGQGIHLLGVKQFVVANNRVRFGHTLGIFVGVTSGDPTEGNTPVVSGQITGNVVDTLFDGTIFSPGSGGYLGGIVLSSIPPTAPYVGQSNGSGGVTQPYPYFYLNNTDATGPAIGNWNITIADNVVCRTLAPAATYSSYNLGQRVGRSGPVNPAITAAALGGYQSEASAMRIVGAATNLLVKGNQISGTDHLLSFEGVAGSAYNAFENVTVEGNLFREAGRDLVRITGEGKIRSVGNTYDGDPYMVSPQRAGGGKWAAGFAELSAITIAAGGAFVSSENDSFRNIGTHMRGTATQFSMRGGTQYCYPAAIQGYDPNNIGIAAVWQQQHGVMTLVIETGDPTNGPVGRILNVCLNSALAMPTSGFYLQYHFTKNDFPIIGGALTAGWQRLTTGTSHILGIDWRLVGAGPATAQDLAGVLSALPDVAEGAAQPAAGQLYLSGKVVSVS